MPGLKDMNPSEQIKAIRAKTGLSQVKFAAQFGIPTRTLEHWEAGTRVPPEYVVNLLQTAAENAEKEKCKMTLMELTNHEAGIIVYGDNSVGVFTWGNYDENRIPILAPGGIPMAWPEADDVFVGVTAEHFDDFRSEIPGTIWLENGETYSDEKVAVTDLDIVYDENNDLVRLFLEDLEPVEYTGTVYTLLDGRKIIAPDMWN